MTVVSDSMFNFVDSALRVGDRKYAGSMKYATSLGELVPPEIDRAAFERGIKEKTGGLFLRRGSVADPDGSSSVVSAWIFGGETGDEHVEGIADQATGVVVVYASPDAILDWRDSGRDYVGTSLTHELVHIFDRDLHKRDSPEDDAHHMAFLTYDEALRDGSDPCDVEWRRRQLAEAYNLIPSEVLACAGEVLWSARARLRVAARRGESALDAERSSVIRDVEKLDGFRPVFMAPTVVASRVRAFIAAEVEEFARGFSL